MEWVLMTKSQKSKREKDKEYEWIEQIQKDQTNEYIKEIIVLQYKHFVESLARKYSRNSDIHEDFVQICMIGLLSAVKRYDRSFKRSFESFAIPTILGEIKRYIRDQTWSVHVPRRIKELGPKIKHAVDDLT